jgi:hypothetical protein
VTVFFVPANMIPSSLTFVNGIDKKIWLGLAQVRKTVPILGHLR